MGTITYDSWSIDVERLLTHLHLVTLKLFQNPESFAMSWLEATDAGDGRSSITVPSPAPPEPATPPPDATDPAAECPTDSA